MFDDALLYAYADVRNVTVALKGAAREPFAQPVVRPIR